MAQFFGELQGTRGEATRLGTKNSGLRTKAASWQGAIDVRLWHNETTGKDMFKVEMVQHHGKGISKVLAEGVVGEESK